MAWDDWIPNKPQIATLSSDGAVKTTKGRVFWIIAAAAATGGAWTLDDSIDDSGTSLATGVAAATATVFIGPFIPPIEFATAIYADIGGTNVTLTVAYN